MPAKKTSSPPPAGKPGRRRIDWEAVERDYRTGRFTLRELEAKHGTNNATIARKIKADRAADPTRWPRDLTQAVRDATNAKLMTELVSNEVSKGQQDVSNTVLAAAEVNKQIILGHRRQASEARAAMEAARAKLLSLAETVADMREAATFVSATESLSRTTKTVIEIERTAFGLDEASKTPEKPAPIDFAAIPEPERMAAYMRLVHGA